MKKNYASLLISVLLMGIIWFIFHRMMPSDYSKGDVPLSEFSTERALKHVEEISKKPHYVGSPNHPKVMNYLEKELQKLGLETQIQQSTILSKWNNLVETKNITARIKGSDSSKALLLLTHFDSAPHTKSPGASDDANGLAVILEGIRTFLHNKSTHKNDIIIVFSDAEELGLNGAYAFASEHPWAKEVGLVINLEARGTAGPSMMLAETNYGNANLIKGFAEANPKFPVSNSLMYSIYKMLPNDTDLTAFREKADIPGYNFAFIDDHFDYHTIQDNFENFTPECLEHQSTYLMPLLAHYSNADLNELKTDDDHVYFSSPIGFFHYPFSWNFPLLIIAFVLFLGVVTIGLGKHLLDFKEIIRGFAPLFLSIILVGLVTFFGWEMIQSLYPQYQDMLHKFTYNGHSYIAAFVLLSMAICFWIYAKFTKSKLMPSHFVAPLFLWFIINLLICIYLEGAAFFIIPAYFGVFILGFLVFKEKSNPFASLALSIPALMILVPFIQLFPIGLGLKMLAGSAVLVALTFALLLPVFGDYSKKANWGTFLFIISIGFFIKAHFQSDFEKGKGKPNSLVYVYDADNDKANWATYDKVLDNWTTNYLGENPSLDKNLNKFGLSSKYNSGYSYSAEAPRKNFAEPTFTFLRDTIVGNQRAITVKIEANKNANRIDVFASEKLKIHHLKANGIKNINQEGSFYKRKKSNVLNYYPINNKPLTLSFQIHKDDKLDMDVMISSFDLLENQQFSIPKRPDAFIPMPFVLTDAIIVKKKLRKSAPKKVEIIEKIETAIDTLIIQKDSLETN
ncbi:M28 family peptidase [Flavobacterium lacus]|uniref:Vacuolar membrane protease n=1 Tax=Flavobacterium lacus TaxID=1353778 RepID=A0A328X311_9FLAO|nr:M28 family peptidase [Flavobacterium lacus]RAR49629.1 peptidase M28-like protein [Flavobacterium lacus]